MKSTIIVDTGIIVEYLKSGKGILPEVYEKYEMVISTSTYAEILASKTFEDHNLEKEVMEFVDKYFRVEETSKKVAIEASRILRKHGVTLTVALIAATALSGKHKLLTEDKKDFNGIDGIEFLEL